MPPPPPPAPPPIPKQTFGGQSKTNNFEPPPDRNALLAQIQKGKRLKKVETNDRSTPLIDGSKSSKVSSNGSAKMAGGNKANGPFPIIPPGGLFAQGIPKLRPTVPRTDGSQSSMRIQSIKTAANSSGTSLDHLRAGQLGGSRSQPPSPVSKPRMSAVGPPSLPAGNPNFPDDLTLKGPAPAPPPANQKPVFNQASNRPTVKRSASQTNLQRTRLTRPPNVKPPPPPKCATPPQAPPPPPPSKPPNILRRQSFGVGESLGANKLSLAHEIPKCAPKNILPPPPPPPRNNSAPNDLNKMVTSSSTSNQTHRNPSFKFQSQEQCMQPPNHVNKMNIAPPPPPNRGCIRTPPPRAPAPVPPAPQHFNSLPAPPSQLKASASMSQAPPPPTRVSSMKQISSFEDRFKFYPNNALPKPERYLDLQKSYPSKVNGQRQGTRRLPPPPPPQSQSVDTSRSPSVLHIQLNYAHS